MFKKLLRFLGILLAVLIGLLIVAAFFIYFRSESVLHQTYTTPDFTPVTVPTDAASIERGNHLVNHISVCVDCHGTDLGGRIVVDDPALGIVVAPNLTTGQNGRGAELTDTDIMRVLRYAVKRDGTSVKVMPADDYTHLSDADLGAIIAYLRSLPPVDSDLPAIAFRPLGRILLALNQLDIIIVNRIDFTAAGSPPMTEEVSAEYGHYLANIAGCTGCHGPGLSGGPIPGAPPDWPQAMNLTPAGKVGNWTEMDFINTIRTGVDPDGHVLLLEMPWQSYLHMTDDELKAIWLFVSSVPPKEAGNR